MAINVPPMMIQITFHRGIVYSSFCLNVFSVTSRGETSSSDISSSSDLLFTWSESVFFCNLRCVFHSHTWTTGTWAAHLQGGKLKGDHKQQYIFHLISLLLVKWAARVGFVLFLSSFNPLPSLLGPCWIQIQYAVVPTSLVLGAVSSIELWNSIDFKVRLQDWLLCFLVFELE